MMITRQLTNDNDNYKFFACSYSILQEFAVYIELMVTSHLEVMREVQVQCTCSSKFLKKVAFNTDWLDIL